jgi:hypothetical protein
MTRTEALKLRTIVEQAAGSLEDKIALEAPSLFPRLKHDGSLIKAGTRINHDGTVKKAAVDLWDSAENDPNNAPTLWEDILYKDGYRIIPETITVTTAFQKGEYGWYGDKLYESLIDNNVYTPEQYEAGWKTIIK